MVRPTSPKTVVSRLFSGSQRPIYLLNASERIVFANAAFASWVDVDEERLLGMQCSRRVKNDATLLEAQLSVPPQARGAMFFETSIRIGAGQRTATRAAVFVTLDAEDDESSTLVIVDDVERAAPEASPFDSEALHRELLLLRQEWSQSYSIDCLVGQSAAMRQVRSQVQLATTTSACRVVIVGNAGTGRETLARTIHHERSQGIERLVPLSCDLLDAELLQTTIESFVRQSAELANETQGTLLLMEVDQLTLEAQSALLGFLEIPELDLQTLSTCRQPLLQLVADEEFRAELAQHLIHLEIRLPSLVERLDDVPLLAQWALEQAGHSERLGGFTPDAIEALLRYPWPREVNELLALVDEAAQNATGHMISKTDLPKAFDFAADAMALPDVQAEHIALDEFLADVESELIQRALKQAKGNRAEAARSLKISRGKLLRRIEQLGINVS